VTEEHRDALRGALIEGQRAVEAGTARPEGERLMREMLSAHFPELNERITQ
jgi:hypothetical protein